MTRAVLPLARGPNPAAVSPAVAGALACALALAAAASAVDPLTVTGRPKSRCPATAKGPDYACLNAALAATAKSAQPPLQGPAAAEALGSGAPDKVGTFSRTGVAEQLGSNFGKSAFPQRPPPQASYSPPLSLAPIARAK